MPRETDGGLRRQIYADARRRAKLDNGEKPDGDDGAVGSPAAAAARCLTSEWRSLASQ